MTRPTDPIAWEQTLPVRPSSPAWAATVKALYGTPLDADELTLFRQLSGGIDPDPAGYTEALAVVGRRGGKSEETARIAIFEAIHGGHSVALAPGQRGLIPVISPLREQSQEILGYARGLCALPHVKRYVEAITKDEIEFKSGLVLRVMTADAVNVSGPTVVCALLDEFAKFPGPGSACPDFELVNSLRPALAPVTGAPPRRFLAITSAYLQDGLAFETERDHFSRTSPVLVIRGPSTTFNPNLDGAWLGRERERVGASVFAREYECAWQTAITEGWFGQVVDTAIDVSTRVREPVEGFTYVVAIDAAFKGDRFAVAVAHAELASGNTLPRLVLDHVQAWRSKNGAAISVEDRIGDVRRLARRYGTALVFADQFSFEPLRALFAREGVKLTERAWTATSKAPTFRRIRDAMADGRVRLLDDPELIRELHSIQGELLRSGGERIEARRGHDDLVSAAVLALNESARFASDTAERTKPRRALTPFEKVWGDELRSSNQPRSRSW